jgi:hypothetical protein
MILINGWSIGIVKVMFALCCGNIFSLLKKANLSWCCKSKLNSSLESVLKLEKSLPEWERNM